MDRRRREGSRLPALAAALALAALIALLSPAAALPPPSAQFYGNVTYRNMTPYPAGTFVTAYDPDGTLCGNFTMVHDGKYGLLSCNGDDDNTSLDEGALDGEVIRFMIGQRDAAVFNGNETWYAGLFILADLVDNRAPNLTSIGDLNATQDLLFTAVLSASDADNDTLNFTVTFLNSSAFFNITPLSANFSLINFTPTNADVGAHLIVITVSDGWSEDSENLTFRVENVNDPPYFTHPFEDQNLTEDSPWSYDINATDLDLAYGDNITYLDNTTLFDIGNATGLINWTPTLPYSNFSVGIIVCDLEGFAEYLNGTFSTAAAGTLLGRFNATRNGTFTGMFNGTLNGTYESTFNLSNGVFTSRLNGTFAGAFNGTFTGTVGNGTQNVSAFAESGVFNGSFSGILPRGCATDSFNVTVTPVNDAPILAEIPALTAEATKAFTYDVDAIDEEGDNLTFNSTWLTNVTLFTISLTTGLISFTPLNSTVGIHVVNISVSDGQAEDWQLVTVEVIPLRYCGDALCISPENCATCPTDCGTCPPGGEGGEGGGGGGEGTGGGAAGGGGGGGGTVGEMLLQEVIYRFYCVPNWQCSGWEPCLPEGKQSRSCVDVNRCGQIRNKPIEKQNCTYLLVATCLDGIQNQGETGVDCGGPCLPCLIFTPEYRFAALPYAERRVGACGDGFCAPAESCACPSDCRSFPETWPWKPFFVLLVLILLAAAGVQGWLLVLVRRGDITPKEYRWRSTILHLSWGTLAFLVTVVCLFTYLLAYCWVNVAKALGIFSLASCLIALLVYLSWHYFFSFDEERMLRRLDRASANHLDKIKALIRLQGRHAVDTEREFSAMVAELHRKRSRYLEFHPDLVAIHNLLRELFAAAERPADAAGISKNLVETVDGLRSSEAYQESLKLHTYMRSLDEKLLVVRDHFVPLFPRLMEVLRMRDAFSVLEPFQAKKDDAAASGGPGGTGGAPGA